MRHHNRTREEPRQDVLQAHAHLTRVMHSKTFYQTVPFEKEKKLVMIL